MVEEPTESSSISEVLSSLSTDDCGLRGGGFLSAAAFRWWTTGKADHLATASSHTL